MAPETENLERELKFAVDVGFELPNLSTIADSTVRLPQQALNTAYFDTPDLRLWQRGLTLRHREGEDRASGKWTMKLPEGGTERTVDRLELSWGGMREEVPAEATRILCGVVRRSMLGRIVVLESLRRRVVLQNAEGTDLGEIDDDLVTVAHGTEKGLSFRQIEFEFGGDLTPEDHDDLVHAVLKKLRKAGAHPETEQKFAKALGRATASAATTKKLRGRVGHRASLEDIVRLGITDGLERVLDYDYLLRLDTADPPVRAVHQARVACRRLRSDLKTYGPLLDPDWLDLTTTELRWIGGRLGEVRDIDVMTDRLGLRREDAAGPGVDGSGHLRETLASQRRAASASLAEDMESARYVDLLDRLHAAALVPPFSSSKLRVPGRGGKVRTNDRANEVLPALVEVPWKKLRRRVRKAGAHPSDHELHRIRIAAKQLRYASEAASPVMGDAAVRTARQAEDLQTVLGDHHDAVAAEEWLRRAAVDGSGMAGFAAGLRAAHERQLQKTLRKEWGTVWSDLSSKKATRWLRTHR
jgi:CHAD domain-containing protein